MKLSIQYSDEKEEWENAIWVTSTLPDKQSKAIDGLGKSSLVSKQPDRCEISEIWSQEALSQKVGDNHQGWKCFSRLRCNQNNFGMDCIIKQKTSREVFFGLLPPRYYQVLCCKNPTKTVMIKGHSFQVVHRENIQAFQQIKRYLVKALTLKEPTEEKLLFWRKNFAIWNYHWYFIESRNERDEKTTLGFLEVNHSAPSRWKLPINRHRNLQMLAAVTFRKL